jgi:phage head maturation protease
MDESTLIRFGGSVKALGDGKVGGYLVRFTDESAPDLTGDFFTKDTDFDIANGDTRSVYYAHGLDTRMGVKKIGKLTATTDDVGVWVEAQLNQRDEYEKAILDLAAKGKLGWSSGAPSHLVTRKSVEVKDGATVHEILTWPIAEGSLTPTPAEPRNDAIALKSLPSLIGMARAGRPHHEGAPVRHESYDDLRALLQDELNEDYRPRGRRQRRYGAVCGSWTSTTTRSSTGMDDDLIRIPYTVTAGNDVTWGTPETVIRTTSTSPPPMATTPPTRGAPPRR